MANSKISALTSATTPLAGTETLPVVQSGSTKKVAVSDLTAGRAVSAATLALDKGSSGTVATFKGGTRTLYVYGDNDAFYISTDSSLATAVGINETSDFISIYTNNSEKVRVNSTGLVTVKSDNLYFETAGKGIDFSANSHAAGMTSELLNWYEEGTWTPAQGAGLTVVGSFSSSGRYTRVGRLVTIHGVLNGSTSIAVSNGGVITSGYPFTLATIAAGASSTSNLAGCTTYLTSGGSSVMYSTAALGAAGAVIVTATYVV